MSDLTNIKPFVKEKSQARIESEQHRLGVIERFNKRTEEKEEKAKKTIPSRTVPMKDLQDYLKPEEAISLLKEAENDPNNGKRNQLLILTLLLTGRRISEVLELKSRNIDTPNGMVLWHILKKRDPNFRKWKPIPQILREQLAIFIHRNKLSPEDYVFFGNKKGRTSHLGRQHAYTIIHSCGKKVGLNIHPHSLRHTYSIWLIRKMNSPSGLILLKNSLEHSNIAMTEHYLQFDPKETAEVQELMTDNLAE